jgi:hydroxymethylpyrimidine pyrophosphatase-like HAD family hydrolase
MEFRVFALDYDGTIAEAGVLDPDVRAAIAEARGLGIIVVLATGRVVSDLKEHIQNLSMFDAIVAENGAVVSLPGGRSRLIGRPPSAAFLEALTDREIPFSCGQCIVDADADFAPQILAVIRALELPRVLVFNQDRVMVLPQGISKGNGLREALSEFKILPCEAIGIGNAENDYDLLSTCGWGVAVGWGSIALQQEADEVLEGKDPSAIATYLRRKMRDMQSPDLPRSIARKR